MTNVLARLDSHQIAWLKREHYDVLFPANEAVQIWLVWPGVS